MKYAVDYQFLPRGFSHPPDQGRAPAAMEFDDETQLKPLLPIVGDHVTMADPSPLEGVYKIEGRIRSRLFSFDRDTCHINIVVEEIDPDSWEALRHEHDTAAIDAGCTSFIPLQL
jgi:hypothetical protein